MKIEVNLTPATHIVNFSWVTFRPCACSVDAFSAPECTELKTLPAPVPGGGIDARTAMPIHGRLLYEVVPSMTIMAIEQHFLEITRGLGIRQS
jgi:hypothetical protein